MNRMNIVSKRRLNLRDRTLFLSKPVAMGVVNVTPDSFSDGGNFLDSREALYQIEAMLKDGATIIDIGGESTRPGSDPVDEKTEHRRVIPVLEEATKHFPEAFFSIDTTKFIIAKVALDVGAHIINDISGLQKEPRLTELAAEYGAGLVIMHSKGDPKSMQLKPEYENVTAEVITFLKNKIQLALSNGVTKSTIIIDPGFGFGKTDIHNLALARDLNSITSLGLPVLTGASRKKTIGSVTGRENTEERLAGTIAFHYDNLCKGAKIIRVHDVKEAMDSIRIFCAINNLT